MAHRPIGRLLSRLGDASAHPAAFAIVVSYAVLWAFFQPDTLNWHGVATLVTWTMTLFITRAEHRDSWAVHAKLDELLKRTGEAPDDLTHMDEREPEEIVEYREKTRREWQRGTETSPQGGA